MLVLGVESSCDETAAAVVEDGRRVLSSVVASQHDLHEEYAGVVPELASRAHVERILPVIREALAQAGVGLGSIDAIAVGHRPGLIGSLLIGVAAAKALAWSLGKPLIGVDHVHAHLYAGVLGAWDEEPLAPQRRQINHADTIFPAIGLVISGGHSSIYSLEGWSKLRRLGATIDDALGEAYDKAAAILGVPYPGGPNLDRLADSGGGDDRAFDFPVSRLAPDSLDFSFSGLKTSLLYAVRGQPIRGGGFERDASALTEARRADLAASFQRAACRAVVLKLARACERLRETDAPPRTLLVGGGVSANSRLRRELGAFARENRLELRLPPMAFCVDNAAMIAGLGAMLLQAGLVADLTLSAVPTTAC